MNPEIKENRIYFFGNPWPNGHKIASFNWYGKIEPEIGLIFHFDLDSENYYAEDNESDDYQEPEDVGDWESKMVWSNYHRCNITSDSPDSELTPFLVGTKENKFDFNKLEGKEFLFDPLPRDMCSDFVFIIYLLGCDIVADHKIKFIKRESKSEFVISWKGKCALAYVGDEEFKYKFEALISPAKFGGIVLPENVNNEEYFSLLSEFVVNYDEFELFENKKYKIKKFVFKK